MNWLIDYLWLIPGLPLVAAGVTAFCGRDRRRLAAGLAIGAMAAAFVLSVLAWWSTWGGGAGGEGLPAVRSFAWFELGDEVVRLGWVLDPLTAVMLVMVTCVGLLIFIYSVGYMAHDDNFTRFFCFLAFFGAAMLGVVLANSLLLLFICWELVGLASYLLIGFWFQKPAAAAAAKKAFITTRVGDLGLLLGMVWLYGETGTLLFYDEGRGCLEAPALAHLLGTTTLGGLALSTAIGLLIFCGAMGKSGQVPLHVWLPDAMEGPTPVSALIHAATMVAAGVFLVARVYPLMAAGGGAGHGPGPVLEVVTWVGALTAVFAALIAVGQTDIKRILAYSTVSQLGYMFVGLGVGGVAVGMFHLITHAFFKALLFLGAGSVIHGAHGEQDIRRMGGLRSVMPVTFATYAVGMLALAGVPLFAGFWSKDAILHAAHGWGPSQGPFYLALAGALLTAFYMTRQVVEVFFGVYRGHAGAGAGDSDGGLGARAGMASVHESPRVMTLPLVVLAVFAVGLGWLGTPFWPVFPSYLGGEVAHDAGAGVWVLMLISTVVVAVGLGAGWRLYGRAPRRSVSAADPLEAMSPAVFGVLRRKFGVDELYEGTVVRWPAAWGRAWDWVDGVLLGTAVTVVSYGVLGCAWVGRLADEFVVNRGFDAGCEGLRGGGGRLSGLHDGRVQHYLRVLALAVAALLLFLSWGWAS